jgi:hypothetical protein
VSINISRKITEILPSPYYNGISTALISSSKAIEKSAASTRDTDYRNSFRYRNIYINREDFPVELMQKANRIISRQRIFSEIDDAAVQKLRDKSRKLENEDEKKYYSIIKPVYHSRYG